MTVGRLAGRVPGVPRTPGGTVLSWSLGWLGVGQGACAGALIRVQAVVMAVAQGQVAAILSRRRRLPRISRAAVCRIL